MAKKLIYKVIILLVALVIIIIGFFGYYAIRFMGPGYCATEDASSKMSRTEALKIAKQSECMKEGKLSLLGYSCNEYTGTWWLNMIIKGRDGCSPACVVNMVTKTAEINWRCTGLVPSK